MQIAMIGLGKMGMNMMRRLLNAGHEVLAYDINPTALQQASEFGAAVYDEIPALVHSLVKPSVLWVMLPAGKVIENMLLTLAGLVSAGDIIIDGGNSNYKDTIRRSNLLAEGGVHLVDVGTSGGIWGLSEGYSMMIGGGIDVINHLRPIFSSLAPSPEQGWGRVGGSGAGHYVKMVHNGIEYGLMQAYAEGFDILKSSQHYDLDLSQISNIWQNGSVVRSWLLDLIALALDENETLDDISPWVEDSGEGRWTVAEAIDLNVPAPVITLALQMRLASRDQDHYSARLLSALRQKFGGHAVIPSNR